MLCIFKEEVSGQIIYRFRRKENGTFKRVPQNLHGRFTTREQAEAWRRQQSAVELSMRDRVQQKLKWKQQFYDFDNLLEEFRPYYAEKAKNTHKTACKIIEHYVFPYFLEAKGLPNANLWPNHYAAFRTWLTQQRSPRSKMTPLAKATQNNIITSLNAFINWMRVTGKIDKDLVAKCEAWAESELRFRGLVDVIPPKEAVQVHSKLSDISEAAADFFKVLLDTGMRFNELRSLPACYLMAGNLGEDNPLHKELKRHNIEYYGYIVLQSQCALRGRRDGNGNIPRKPLKGRQTMGLKDARTIPIMSLESWNILAKRFLKTQADFEANVHGANPLDYLLFEDLAFDEAYSALQQAYVSLGITAKPYHCGRHTFVARMAGQTRSFFLIRAITGHKSRAFERYLHVYEEIAQMAKSANQSIQVLASTPKTDKPPLATFTYKFEIKPDESIGTPTIAMKWM